MKSMEDPIVEYLMTVQEALAFVKRSRNRWIFLSCSQFARAVNQEGVETDMERGRSVSSNVKVNAKVAAKYIEDAYRYMEEAKPGAYRVRVAYCSTCLFIGSFC